ncbi:hypothetical protein [Haloarchaeobius salinus]|uniref:hypothetical protein n=1 Tax=Haloarchaeobius salinus TaxID=1198298 RepID=UPI00210ABBEC|nr:hypothetical protein [Haloarchaeobius salinus]
MSTVDSLRERVRSPFEQRHDAATTALVAGWALVLGLVAGWVVADFEVRQLTTVVVALAAGILLYGRETPRDIVAGGLYMLAALVALFPVAYELHVFTVTGMAGVDSPWTHVLTVSDLLLFVLFLAVAAVPALLGFLVGNWTAVRGRLAGIRS